MIPLRSVLYVPASNVRAVEKAPTLAVDAIIFDLEDSVADDDKLTARQRIVDVLANVDFGSRQRIVRINQPDAGTGAEDLRIMLESAPDAILLPKLRRAVDLERHLRHMEEVDPAAKVKVWAMVETARSILDLHAFADLAHRRPPRLAAFVLGINDLACQTGVKIGGDRARLAPWLMQTVLAAKAGGLAAIDGVYNYFDDEEGFRTECVMARNMGFDGKTLVHPRQIDPCNEIFSPTRAEVQEAERIVSAFDEPGNEARAVLSIDGRMCERLHLNQARRTREMAQRIDAE